MGEYVGVGDGTTVTVRMGALSTWIRMSIRGRQWDQVGLGGLVVVVHDGEDAFVGRASCG